MAAVEEDDDGESPRATSHSAKRGLLSLRSTSRGSAVALGQSVSMRARVAPDSESPRSAITTPRVSQVYGATAARLRAEVSVHRLTHQALRKVLGGEASADDASEDPADARNVIRNARVVLDIADKMIVDSRAGPSSPTAAGGGHRMLRQDSPLLHGLLRENTEPAPRRAATSESTPPAAQTATTPSTTASKSPQPPTTRSIIPVSTRANFTRISNPSGWIDETPPPVSKSPPPPRTWRVP